jgi:hypothetical protein
MKRGLDKLPTSGGFVADFKRRWDSFIASNYDLSIIHDYDIIKPVAVKKITIDKQFGKTHNLEHPGQLKTPEVKR